MSIVLAEVRPSRIALATPPVTRRRRRRPSRNRVEVAVILVAFALALAFAGSQSNLQASTWTWTDVQSASTNEVLEAGVWLPLGEPANLSDELMYQFCVTTQGAGTLLMNPSELLSTVALTAGAPVTTCAYTNDLPAVEAVQPSVSVVAGASDVTVLHSSWQRLETNGT